MKYFSKQLSLLLLLMPGMPLAAGAAAKQEILIAIAQGKKADVETLLARHTWSPFDLTGFAQQAGTALFNAESKGKNLQAVISLLTGTPMAPSRVTPPAPAVVSPPSFVAPAARPAATPPPAPAVVTEPSPAGIPEAPPMGIPEAPPMGEGIPEAPPLYPSPPATAPARPASVPPLRPRPAPAPAAAPAGAPSAIATGARDLSKMGPEEFTTIADIDAELRRLGAPSATTAARIKLLQRRRGTLQGTPPVAPGGPVRPAAAAGARPVTPPPGIPAMDPRFIEIMEKRRLSIAGEQEAASGVASSEFEEKAP